MPFDWETYCDEALPELLVSFGSTAEAAAAVGADIRQRADSFAASGVHARDVLRGPFFEEVVDYKPAGASLASLASVTVVVRCSLLEVEHCNGVVNAGGIEGLTTLAAAPLIAYLNDRYCMDRDAPPAGVFAGLDERYPRAWAALGTLAAGCGQGGRMPVAAPRDAPIPSLPEDDEVVEAPRGDTEIHVLLSAIEPRLDRELLEALRKIATGDYGMLTLSHLSRLSRNHEKLFRIVEIVLAHDAEIITTNHLIRSSETWTRTKRLLAADTFDHLAGVKDRKGLSGTHRRTAEEVAAQHGLTEG